MPNAKNASEAKQDIDAGHCVVVDTRLPFDFFGGRIPGAINMPARSIPNRRASLPPDRILLVVAETDTLAIEHCRSIAALGFSNIAYLIGGMDAWSDAGLETETISTGL